MFTNENDCYYVSSRGLLKSCDIHSLNPMSSISYLKDYNMNFENQSNYTTIYICNSAMKDFVLNIDKINYYFILVSGDCDETIPNDILDKNHFDNLINNKWLVSWYSQNCVFNHPKLFKMPIGLAYHVNDLPNKIEENLISIKNKGLPFYERKIKIYTTFHLNIYDWSKLGYARKEALQNINKELIFYEPNRISYIETWNNQIEYAFVASPHGNGLDCHRTWEALILGCIPITKKSLIDDLYEDLPVLIVENWESITQELLEETVNNFKLKTFNYDKLLSCFGI